MRRSCFPYKLDIRFRYHQHHSRPDGFNWNAYIISKPYTQVDLILISASLNIQIGLEGHYSVDNFYYNGREIELRLLKGSIISTIDRLHEGATFNFHFPFAVGINQRNRVVLLNRQMQRQLAGFNCKSAETKFNIPSFSSLFICSVFSLLNYIQVSPKPVLFHALSYSWCWE